MIVYGRTVQIRICCGSFLFRDCGFQPKGEMGGNKKNECMFEKMLGKRSKTRYDININGEGCEFIVRSSCCA